MKVTVKNAANETKELDVPSDLPVSQFRERVGEATGIPAGQLRAFAIRRRRGNEAKRGRLSVELKFRF